MMIIEGKFYTSMTGNSPNGNSKYSKELKECIEKAGQLCLDNLKNMKYQPIMMLGNIQSGKTRAFIGLMALCFDNDFDMTIILTKCSKALVKQTVSRLTAEFDKFRTGNATVGDVVAQDILDIDFKGARSVEEKEDIVRQFLKRYRGKKRIIVVKKQADNVDRMNMFIRELVAQGTYKRILIVDDEADITSIGYEKFNEQDLSLRRISGAINTMRRTLHSNIEYVLMQVTATPYALYLQPESFSNENIMPIKPSRTIVVPTGDGYIGGQYYFIDSQDVSSPNYSKARYLIHFVEQDEMDILNGTKKNSGRNSVINDRRVVKLNDFIKGQSNKNTFRLPALRSWLFNVLVGAAILQLNPNNEGLYVSSVLHAATIKSLHKHEGNIILNALEEIKRALIMDINDPDVMFFLKEAYDDLKESVYAYKVLLLPSFAEACSKVARITEDGELEGLITEIDVKEVNSDNDITILLNNATGELKLENSITIFVGGQVLDRGITIPNLIGFFYGRDPVTMQQDTVMQHCRMFGYRNEELLSVTRFYTTARLFSDMREITERDNILRERMIKQSDGKVVYLEAGGRIKACSPQKILASKINSILPQKRYLPIGFELDPKTAIKIHNDIYIQLKSMDAILPSAQSVYHKGDSTDGKYVLISANVAISLIEKAYKTLMPKTDGKHTDFQELEAIFWFSITEQIRKNGDKVALIVRTGRNLSVTKYNGQAYQDSPDDGNNEGALAKALRNEFPVLVLTEQVNKEWKYPFWWPVYYTPCDMNVGIYAEEQARTGVGENLFSMGPYPIQIKDFPVIINADVTEDFRAKIISASKEAVQYFEEQFKVEDSVTSPKKRKEIECFVFIDEEDRNLESEFVMEELHKKCSDACKIIDEQLKNSQYLEELNTIKKYLIMLVETGPDDEIRNQVQTYLDIPCLDKTKSNKIIRIITEMEELNAQLKEQYGYFQPLGDGKCEIHIFHKAILDFCKNHKVSDINDLAAEFGSYVVAHEIFHALHYADVMTESGRWLVRRSAIVKQSAVQESLAEYFALCYVKDIIAKKSTSRFDLANWIRSERSQEPFPKDGGYSGSLILEKMERQEMRIKAENTVYCRLYKESLKDMVSAFQLLKK